jgi:uncharacterized damage-inducible protein DinB
VDKRTIAAVIERSVAGDPWHGSSLTALLADVTAEEAAHRPIRGAHSILEIVLHVAAWAEEVGARLAGAPPGDPADGDWPLPCPWDQAHARLAAAHAGLLRRLAAFPDERLGVRHGHEREPALGTGHTWAAMAVGVAEHNAYHGGQIALLKRALRGPAGTHPEP